MAKSKADLAAEDRKFQNRLRWNSKFWDLGPKPPSLGGVARLDSGGPEWRPHKIKCNGGWRSLPMEV